MALFEALGLTSHDMALLVFCPIGGVIGSFAQAIIKTIDLAGPPTKEGDMRTASKELQEMRGIWFGLRFVLGGILGLVLGLYFVGAMQPTTASAAKIIALSIIAGYAAPKVWKSQEKIVEAKLNLAAEATYPQSSSKRDETEA